MRQRRWKVYVAPLFGSSEMASGECFCVVGWGATTQAGGVFLYHNGSARRVSLFRDAGTGSSGLSATWSRYQILEITVDVGAGTLTLAGATTGNGTVSLTTPGTICDGSLSWASVKDQGLPSATWKTCSGLISQPLAA
jgi:hypothetical protein